MRFFSYFVSRNGNYSIQGSAFACTLKLCQCAFLSICVCVCVSAVRGPCPGSGHMLQTTPADTHAGLKDTHEKNDV